MLIGVVHGSDFAILTGWSNGAIAFRWAVNGEAPPDYWRPSAARGRHEECEPEEEEESQPVERASVVAVMCTWAPGGDAAVLDDILSRRYLFAEDGLFEAFAALGAVTNGLVYDTYELAEAENALAPPMLTSDQLDLIGGDPASLPVKPGRVYLAAVIDHDSEAWANFGPVDDRADDLTADLAALVPPRSPRHLARTRRHYGGRASDIGREGARSSLKM